MPQHARPPSIATRPGPGDGSAHAGLLRRLEAAPDDATLELAMQAMQTGADMALLLATAKAMVRVGIAGLATRLLRSAGDAVRGRDEIRHLVAQLESLPTGEVPPDQLESTAQANLDALLATRPHLRPLAESLDAMPPGVRLFRTRQGNVHIVRDDPDGRLQMIQPLQDHEAHAAATALPAIELGTTFLLLGVPSAPLWRRLVATHHEGGYRPALDVLETSPEALAVWLRLVDVTDALREERVTVCAGPEAWAQYETFLRAQHARQLPTAVLRSFRAMWTPPQLDPAFFPAVEQARQRHRRDLLARQAAIYDGRDARTWLARFDAAATDGAPLRVVGFVTRYSTYIQHVMRDLAAAFARRGCRLDIVIEPHDAVSVVDTWAALATEPYDLAIVINHLRRELADLVHQNLPFVCWIQDHMDALWSEEAGRSIGPFDLVLGQNATEMCLRFGYPEDRFLVTTNLTDPVTYSDTMLPEATRAPHACDVSFVGHGSATPHALVKTITVGAPDGYRQILLRFVDLAAAALADAAFLTYLDRLELLLAAESEVGGPRLEPAARRRFMLPAVARLYDRLVRHQSLEWTAAWATRTGRQLRLLGRGWAAHPTLGAYAGGEIANGEALRAVCQASTVNLQLNGYSAMHQRLLDAVACGGFVLSRFSPRDFLNRAAATVADAIRTHSIASLDALVRRREADGALDAALGEMERLGMPVCRRDDHPARQREVELLRHLGIPAEDPVAFFQRVRHRVLRPDRKAGDMPGFSDLTFDSAAALEARLNQFIDDAHARQQAMAPVRAWVLRHGTYDGLIDRMLEHLAASMRKEAARDDA